ncbi:MAG: ABC transporter permease, partial [Alistipes sp.]|nr:ABC transporter permease [Alistipes sp.]
MSNIFIIIQREFNERVRKKSFIITTVLMPVLMIALMVAPALIMEYSSGDEKRIAVIDESGVIASQLRSDKELSFEPTALSVDEARKQLTDHYAVLCIGSDVFANPSNVKFYVNSSSSIAVEGNISKQLEHIIETEKLKGYNIDNLQQILDEVKTSVSMQTFRNDKSQEEDTQAQSSVAATAIGYVLGFILYMFLLIYGAMVMQSVIEEKNSRVLEVMVSSVRPFELMMGKILGIASVAVVQILIWGVLIGGVGALVIPHLMPDQMMAGVEAMQTGAPQAAELAAAGDFDPEMMQA